MGSEKLTSGMIKEEKVERKKEGESKKEIEQAHSHITRNIKLI